MNRQQREFYHNFSRHGSGDALMEISPQEVAFLIHLTYFDLFATCESWFDPQYERFLRRDFYSITPNEIDSFSPMTEDQAFGYLESAGGTNLSNYVYMYLKNLSELYRRRVKFFNILKNQPFPSVEQIGLRCLLEYGNCDDKLLFSWMAWRKLIYDIDNRSAQETGYLFEPIIASCLGGESVSHRNSPVRRVGANGHLRNEGRQIDCYVRETSEVYELKLRVTTAASGQGRFSEEMSFPYEAKRAGLTPVLIVFDSTSSLLLEKLSQEYVRQGGRVVVGDAAWIELTRKAGDEMGRFILKYIKPPIEKMQSLYECIPSDIRLAATDTSLTISSSEGNGYSISRSRDVGVEG